MRTTLTIALAAMALGVMACSSDDATVDPPDSGTNDAATATDTATPDDSASNIDAPTSDGTTADVAPIDDPGPGPSAKCVINKDSNGFFKLTSSKADYIVRLPPTYDINNPKPTRLLVSLHGCGDSAMNNATWAAVPYSMRATQDYIAISLGGRDGTCWTTSTDSAIVDAAIAHVRTCFYVHQKKIVLAGYSSGGDLTWAAGLANASKYAGLLVLHSDLSQNFGANNVSTKLAATSWKINVALNAGVNDTVYPIATVRNDRDKLLAAGFPLKYDETTEDHNATSDDWSLILLPKMANWTAP